MHTIVYLQRVASGTKRLPNSPFAVDLRTALAVHVGGQLHTFVVHFATCLTVLRLAAVADCGAGGTLGRFSRSDFVFCEALVATVMISGP